MFQVHFSMMHHGDIVFCTVHPMNCYYTHLVLDIEKDMFTHEKKYWIGNMQGRKNGWCFREHLHGIVMEILVTLGEPGVYGYRPHPQPIYSRVKELLSDGHWREAEKMCEAKAETAAPSNQLETC